MRTRCRAPSSAASSAACSTPRRAAVRCRGANHQGRRCCLCRAAPHSAGAAGDVRLRRPRRGEVGGGLRGRSDPQAVRSRAPAPARARCGWEWAFHGSASAASPQRAHLHGRGRQQLLMRLATVGACQWLIGAVPPALLADMGGGLLRRHLRGATGARMVVEFLLFSALPWWALRQALHDNDADQIGWTLAHACHQLRAADLPIHAQACALHLGIHRGAHREVQRVLRGLCCCPRRPIRPPSASLKHQQVLRDPSHGAPPPPRSSRSPPANGRYARSHLRAAAHLSRRRRRTRLVSDETAAARLSARQSC